jgi:hypothetical protein
VVLSYELSHRDGRKSFPLVLINWAPTSSEMGMLTLHASAFIDFQTTASLLHTNRSQSDQACPPPQADVSKVIEIREGPEALTEELINTKLLLNSSS